MKRLIICAFVLVALCGAFAQKPSPLDERKAKAERMSEHDRARIYAEIARDLVELANQQYTSNENDKAEASVKDAVSYAEKSVAAAQQKHKSPYLIVAWETDRVALLQGIEKGALFTKLRGDLLVTLYNNKEVWPKFGYEGSSADKGGYINRGFNDIDWLPQA